MVRYPPSPKPTILKERTSRNWYLSLSLSLSLLNPPQLHNDIVPDLGYAPFSARNECYGHGFEDVERRIGCYRYSPLSTPALDTYIQPLPYEEAGETKCNTQLPLPLSLSLSSPLVVTLTYIANHCSRYALSVRIAQRPGCP